MSACEKCWADSRARGISYLEVLKARVDEPCSAQQQAGPNAGKCPECGQMTLHQHTGEPMCGCKESSHDINESAK